MGRMTSHILWKIKKSLKPPASNTSEAEDLFGVYHCNAVGLNPCDYCQNGNLLM